MSETETKIINIKDRNFKNKLNELMRVDQKNQSNLYNIVFNIIQKIQKLGDDALIHRTDGNGEFKGHGRIKGTPRGTPRNGPESNNVQPIDRHFHPLRVVHVIPHSVMT